MEVDKQNHAKLMMPSCRQCIQKKHMRYELFLVVLFQEHEMICIHYNNATSY